MALGIHNIGAPKGANKNKKRVGRGPGSGHGKTSTRGQRTEVTVRLLGTAGL